MNKTNYITPAGYQKLYAEWEDLTKNQRPQIVQVVQWAAGNGDRSENADYIYGKRRLREIDSRLRFLNKRINESLQIDPEKQASETVLFGATVKVQDENEAIKIYRIVGIDETNPKRNKISWKSPIAKALLGKKVGDSCMIKTLEREYEVDILQIKYMQIEDE